MQQRAILHSDMNSFYASVEMMLDPSLRGKAVAVCGSVEDRHGIVLAKSELAKKAGVDISTSAPLLDTIETIGGYITSLEEIFG